MTETWVYIASSLIILWGVSHIIPVRAIVKGFGDISADNKKVLVMEILTEGLTLIFLGVLPLLIVLKGLPYAVNAFIVYRAEAGFLLVMAALTLFTGARTPVVWYKICPAVKGVAAMLFVWASVL